MRTESLLIAAGIAGLMVVVAVVAAHLLKADMRRTVERRTKAPTDMTALSLMTLGGLIVGGIPLATVLLWATWA